MIPRILLLPVLLFLFLCPTSFAEEGVEIPLSEIWGYHLPGTKDIRSLGLEQLPALRHGPLGLLELLGKERAEPGYAVVGTGEEALNAAQRQLPEGEVAQKVLPADREISLVYFSYGFARYIVLKHVERIGNTIEISYLWEPSGTSSLAHFALIPVGKLPPGEYDVKLTQLPNEMLQKFPAETTKHYEERVRRAVCQSFRFTVEEKECGK